jgi:hypothetical protein
LVETAQASDLLNRLILEEHNHLSTADLQAIEQTREILNRYMKTAFGEERSILSGRARTSPRERPGPNREGSARAARVAPRYVGRAIAGRDPVAGDRGGRGSPATGRITAPLVQGLAGQSPSRYGGSFEYTLRRTSALDLPLQLLARSSPYIPERHGRIKDGLRRGRRVAV